MELRIISPTDEIYALPVSFNYEELRQELTAKVDMYKGLIVTEDTMTEAKDTRAKLNKVKEALDSKRIEVKKAYLEPYADFEAKMKSLVSIVDEVVLIIDTQVKGFENQKKDAKLAEIKAYFDSQIGDLSALVPFEKVYDPKWLNATVKIKAITSEIDSIVKQVNYDLSIITDLHHEFELQIKDTYLRKFSLSDALAEKTRLEEQKAKLAELEAKKAELVPEPQFTPPAERKVEAVEALDFRVWVTPTQKNALKAFLLNNKIKYGPVPKGE